MAACLRSRFLAMSRSSAPSSASTSLNAPAMARCSGQRMGQAIELASSPIVEANGRACLSAVMTGASSPAWSSEARNRNCRVDLRC